MATLKIYISGICVQVPKEDRVTYLFPDVSSEEKIASEMERRDEIINRLIEKYVRRKFKNVSQQRIQLELKRHLYQFHKTKLKPHKTFIQFNDENLASEYPAYPFYQDEDEKWKGLWMLDKKHLEIENAQGPLQVVTDILTAGPSDQFEVRVENQHDQGFASPMWTARGALRKAKANLVAPVLTGNIDSLNSRFVIKNGSLTNHEFSVDKQTRKYFLFNLNGCKQPISTTLCFTVEVPGNSIRLKATSFNNANDYETILLKPKAGENVVEIRLMNTELDDWIYKRIARPRQDDVTYRLIQEYFFYQNMLENPRFKEALPDFDSRRQSPTEALLWHLPPGDEDDWLITNSEVSTTNTNCSPATAG